MTRKTVLLLAFGLALGGCGLFGSKGNDTGGVIPWSPEAEATAMAKAQQQCGYFGKYARITSVNRQPGDYISYVCQWEPPRPGRHRG